MKHKIFFTTLMMLCSIYSFGQYVTNLMDSLTKRGYVIIDKDNKDLKSLERWLALDIRLNNKHDSIANIFKSLQQYSPYIGNSSDSDDVLNKVREFMDRGREIKSNYKYNRDFDNYNTFLDAYEKAINRFNKPTDMKDIEYITNEFKSLKTKFQQDSILTATRVNRENTVIASLPTKAAVKAKFRTYTHRTGNVFEMFPVGFTPKTNKPVIDRVFGHKAMYREVDGNGMNTLKIEYYDSGSILNVTVYKGGDMIYNAEYRDHTNKPYQILSKSADGKFELLHKRVFDAYDNKTTVTTQYQYLPLDYWYE